MRTAVWIGVVAAILVVACIVTIIIVTQTRRPPPPNVHAGDVLFVTAFKDIGRGHWPSSQLPRSNETYLKYFQNLVRMRLPLVAFLDDDVAKIVKSRYGFSNTQPYDMENTFLSTHLAREQEIMQSDAFRALWKQARETPLLEHTNPQYTLTMHNKVVFLKRAAERFPNFAVYAWIDFGYMREKCTDTHDFSSLRDLKTVILDSAVHDLQPAELPDKATLIVKNPTIIRGSAFFVPRHHVNAFYDLYKSAVDDYQAENLADDDQSILVACVKKRADMFSFVHTKEWFQLLKPYKK